MVVLGGVDIFGGSGTMGGVLLALFVLAFVQNALGLAGVAPEEQQIVTGAVLIVTLVVFGASGFIKRKVAAPWHFRSASATAPERRVGFAEASNDDGR